MKKILLALTITGFIPHSPAYACDICGCSAGNYFIGPFPIFHRYFVGTRYSFRSYQTVLNGDPSQFSKDFYQTYELWGGYNLGPRWQVLAFLPYNINKQVSDDGTRHSNGLGDLSLLASFALLPGKKKNERLGTFQHQLRIGGGLKIPTGKYSVDPDELVPSANSQPGSGSLDFVSTLQYVVYKKNWGLSNSLTYKINKEASGFRFGNRVSASSFLFRNFITEKVNFSPNAGILYEHLNPNRQDGVKVDQTGGYALHAAAGLELSYGKWMMGVNLQLPVSENYSDGQTRSRIRGMVHLGHLF